MKHQNLYFYFLLLSILIISPFFVLYPQEQIPTDYGLEDAIPVDPNVTMGEFENGVNYYIRVNKKPENRATFWLAVDAGSVLEDDDQQGLAHFAEHMGFNGTKHFAKQELIDYLESIGMRFGPELNAYTSFDETVYFLNVPTDSAYFVETGFQILEDWAHLVSFEEEEIDKERGVVQEEWRLGRGAWMRMLDKQLPIIFKNSRYAERLPIGKKEILESCSYETLHKFYKDWYRPDLMAIVAVGDFDKDWIFNLMKKHFASIPPVENPRQREMYPVPDHDEALFAIATDEEADRTQVGVYFKSEYQPKKTVDDYRVFLMEKLYNTMLNNRLNELTKKADPPFLFGFSGKGGFVRTKEVYYLAAGVKEDGIELGLDALLTEANRVKKFGFTETEFERTKIKILRDMESAYKEQDKTESARHAQMYVYHFLSETPIPSAKQELDLSNQLLPGIKLTEINKLANEWITDNNRVVLVSAPEKDNVIIPTEDKLLSVFAATEQKDIEPFVDAVSEAPLVANPPEQAEIIEENTQAELGITELKLANGVHVLLKPTDFKNDEILFDAYSFGGTSLTTDDKYMSAQVATDIIMESGAGGFSIIELEKKLTGKVVNINTYIGDKVEGIKGSASPQDMETLFQLIYLAFTDPRKDNESFESYLTRMKGFIENRSARPETAFNDTIQVTMAQYHPRSRPWTVSLLDEINYEMAYSFYKDRFADAGDFNFFFVGNFDIEKIKPLIQIYLGGLPAIDRVESWKDRGVSPPKGVIKKEVYKGVEPKSTVRLAFTGHYEFGYKNFYALSSLVDVMRIKLRETLREDLGGTYGVSIWRSVKLYPREEYGLNIMFGCAPERVDEMIQTVFQQIDSIKTVGPGDNYITKVRETQTRTYEVNLKKNGYWLNELWWKHRNDEDLMDIIRYPDYVRTLSAEVIQQAANEYFNTDNYVQVVLYPDNVQ
jgi:zinc protease